jgi:FkbM family methyltransferase
MADWQSRARLVHAKLARRLPGATPDLVPLRIRALRGERINVRPGTTDLAVIVDDYVYGHQLPPAELVSADMRQVCELGSNVGLGLAGLAALYPNARVLGVEPDPANAALARLNIEPWQDRCAVVEAAIWDEDVELTVEGDEEYGLRVRPRRDDDAPSMPRIAAITIDSLLAEHMPEGTIDYLHLNIEGAEPRVLRAAQGWASRVRSIRVELHPDLGFYASDCIAALERLGFQTRRFETFRTTHVFGLRA